jgi:tRNA pseudouridine13 synthase
MKLKQRPEDFRVEEMSRIEPGVDGAFSVYRLEKTGIGTREAMAVVRREWRLRPRAVAWAGLKDRHAHTGQVVSVRDGPRRNFEGRGFKLNYLGRSERPAGRGTIRGNRFRIVVRALGAAETAAFAARAREACAKGFLDYYDDQRFGSTRGTPGEFVARALLAGDAETALRRAVAAPARKDPAARKRRAKALRERWGEWEALAGELGESPEQRICRALADGATFLEAYELLDRPLRAIHLAAWQAHVFNECLRRVAGAGPSCDGLAGPYVFPPGAPAALRGRRLPLASAKAPEEPNLDAVLTAEGVDRETLARWPFRSGERDLVCMPEKADVADPEPDELNEGKHAVKLAFTLPPGAYATMLVKTAATV